MSFMSAVGTVKCMRFQGYQCKISVKIKRIMAGMACPYLNRMGVWVGLQDTAV